MESNVKELEKLKLLEVEDLKSSVPSTLEKLKQLEEEDLKSSSSSTLENFKIDNTSEN